MDWHVENNIPKQEIYTVINNIHKQAIHRVITIPYTVQWTYMALGKEFVILIQPLSL